MLRHRFSNERWGGGGGGALNHLPLLFCKSVYIFYNNLHAKKVFKVNLVASEALITHVKNRAKPRRY